MNILDMMIRVVWGVDAERLKQVPRDERLYLARIAFQVIVTLAFMFAMAFSATRTVMDHGGPFDIWLAGAFALLVALLVVLIDVAIMVHSMFSMGEREIMSLFLNGSDDFKGRLKKLAPRLFLAFVLSMTVGMFADLAVFKAEIDQVIEIHHRQANAQLFREVQSIVGKAISDKEAEVQSLIAESNGLLQGIQSIEGVGSDDSKRIASEIVTADDKLKGLAEKKTALAQERAVAEQNASMEGAGVAIEGRTSGKDGCGKLCKRWQSEVKRIDDETAAVAAEMERLQAERSRLQGERAAVGEKLQAGESAAAQAKRSQRSELDRRIETARADLAALQANQAETVTARARGDMRYVRKEEGLAARFVALKEVGTTYPSTLPVMALISLSIMALELGTVLSVEFASRKLAYWLLVASAYHETLHRERARQRRREADEGKYSFNLGEPESYVPEKKEPVVPPVSNVEAPTVSKTGAQVEADLFAKFGGATSATEAKPTDTMKPKPANGAASDEKPTAIRKPKGQLLS